MNRRTFIAALVGLPAAIKAMCSKPAPPRILGLTLAEQSANPLPWLQTKRVMFYPWFQTTRHSNCVTMEYEDALDKILEPDPVKRRIAWHSRRRDRFKRNLARQLAMPAPNLP